MHGSFHSKIVDPGVFEKGDTFSFRSQPYLRELFETVRDRKLPLTIVVGAGVSMNSSLPSWRALIDKMTATIADPEVRSLASRDGADLMRKAEIILQLIKDENRNIQDHEIIRDALYQRDLQVIPGELAKSIARLAYATRADTRLLTTNFDIILEESLLAYFDESVVKSFSMKPGGSEAWTEWNADPDQVGVLHLHGLVRQARNPEEPIILTESQFLKHGAQVRAIISASLKNACTLFIGLSMSDPNLVGPLYESSPATSPRFSLVVPPAVDDVSPTQAARYAISSARYLEKMLGLKPIFLKSHSQLNQAISDLALAVVEPDRYRPGVESADSLVYSRRLTKALDDCYTAIGCEPQAEIPAGDAAEDLTTRLHDALEIPGGPLDVLRDLAQDYDEHVLGSNAGENFGLFLWLRTRGQENGRRRYTINLVGTSVYTHREEWSLRHHVTVDRGSDFAAAQAVFTGAPQAANLTPLPIAQIWRGILAAPILMSGTGSDYVIGGEPADVLTVGAITLNSTFVVNPNGDEVAPHDLSLISKLDSERTNQLLVSLQLAAEYAINLG